MSVFHWGGDEKLALNFIGVVESTQKAQANLFNGLLSAKMYVGAKESAARYSPVSTPRHKRERTGKSIDEEIALACKEDEENETFQITDNPTNYP